MSFPIFACAQHVRLSNGRSQILIFPWRLLMLPLAKLCANRHGNEL